MLNAHERAFFDPFAGFTPDPAAHAEPEFARLAAQRRWKPGGKARCREWRRCFGRQMRAEPDAHDGGARGFFDRFAGRAGFAPDAGARVGDEFARLALRMGWREASAEYRERRRQAFQLEFERHWGADAAGLGGWQALCAEVGAAPAPASVTACKKALRRVHVNLVDLVDGRRTGERVRRFGSVAALRRYTVPDRIFPKEGAKADGFLKALLRTLV